MKGATPRLARILVTLQCLLKTFGNLLFNEFVQVRSQSVFCLKHAKTYIMAVCKAECFILNIYAFPVIERCSWRLEGEMLLLRSS